LASVTLASVVAASFAFGVYAASDIKLLINGKSVDTPVEIIEGSSYVPLRVVSEALGAEVKWDGDSRTITINGGAKAAEAPKSNVKSYNVNINVASGPMKLDITKVTLDPEFKRSQYSKPIKAVVLDAKIENTTDGTVVWYPSHGKIVTNAKEQVENGILNSDDVDGEFIGKVIKSGKIVFEIKGDLDAVTSFNYVIEGARNKTSYAKIGDDKTVEVILK
jgi:hypothetical protein